MTSKTHSLTTALLLAVAVAACGDDGSSSGTATVGQPTGASGITITTNDTVSGSGSGTSDGPGSDSNSNSNPTSNSSPTDATSMDASASGTGDPTTGGTTGGGPKLDVGAETGFETSDSGTAEGCTAVDLLFVIDNSVSMGSYQNALSLAFPAFADAILDVLPPGTSLHVGVTSTTMGDSNSGSTTNCKATGDGQQPQEFFYQTPDMGNNGINGAQGRLYKPGNLDTYYSINTDAGPAEIDGLKAWFAQAAKIGEGGSQIEMSAAAAGWAADPVNAATNGGFIRDAGAVFALFILQDEPDQTPWTIDGQPGGLAMLQKLEAAKAVCGGAQCMIGGGFVNTNCMNQVPLGDLLNNLGAPPVVSGLPAKNLAKDFPDQAAAEMNMLLRDVLAGVIAQKCEEIQPPG